MIPLAISIAALANALIYITLPFLRHMLFSLTRTLFESFAAAVITAFVTRLALNQLVASFGDAETFITLITHAGVAGMAGIGAGIATLWVLRSRELKEVRAATHHWFLRYIPFFGNDIDKGL